VRVVFFGTSAFAVPALRALAAIASVDIPVVFTQPPRQAGRGHKVTRTAVHDAALKLGLPVETPDRLTGGDPAEALATIRPDLGLVAAYGLLLPPSILAVPRFGCVNIHASLLPRWRGASPIQQAILAGDPETGVDFFQMERGLDTGPILLREPLAIAPDDTASSLGDKLARTAAGMLPRLIDGLSAGRLKGQPQAAEGACYAPKISKADGIIDWQQPALQIERKLRAFTPWPGAWTTLDGEALRLLGSRLVADRVGPPGTVIAAPLVVASGNGALAIDRLQRIGRKAMPVEDLLRGFPIAVGSRLGT